MEHGHEKRGVFRLLETAVDKLFSQFQSQTSAVFFVIFCILILLRLSPFALQALVKAMEALKEIDIVARFFLLTPVVFFWIVCMFLVLVLAVISLGTELIFWIEVLIVIGLGWWAELKERERQSQNFAH